MNWIRYSIGNTRAQNTMPMSIGAPQVHASGVVTAVVAAAVAQVRLGHQAGKLKDPKLLGRGLN